MIIPVTGFNVFRRSAAFSSGSVCPQLSHWMSIFRLHLVDAVTCQVDHWMCLLEKSVDDLFAACAYVLFDFKSACALKLSGYRLCFLLGGFEFHIFAYRIADHQGIVVGYAHDRLAKIPRIPAAARTRARWQKDFRFRSNGLP